MAALGWAAHLIGILPLACLAYLHVRGERRGLGWWLMGAGFGVSFVANFFPWRLASQVYPISQAGVFALVLLPSRKAFVWFVGLLLFVAAFSILARDAVGADVLLRVVAWLGVSGFAYAMLLECPLRDVLTYGFAALTFTWLAYLTVPGMATYLVYQVTWLAVVVAWCAVVRRARE